jgi:hypothetical protein
MNNSNSNISSKHIDELCLAYVEDVLSPDEKTAIAQHLDRCPTCAGDVQDMSRWVAFVRDHRDALCPEEWQLFDYARGAQDISALLASHVERCPECRSRVDEYRTATTASGVPHALWERMTHVRGTSQEAPPATSRSWLYRIWEQVAQAFSPPLAMAGAVAAAALVVVILYPSSPSGPALGLSSVSWGPDHADMTLMGEPDIVPKGVAPRTRLAAIVYFKDFKDKPEPDRIDALYRVLEPGRDVRRHYEAVSPATVKEALQKAGTHGSTAGEVLRVLRDKLSVSRALIVTLSEKRDRFAIQAQLFDTGTGVVVREREVADVSAASLSEELEAVSESVFTRE